MAIDPELKRALSELSADKLLSGLDFDMKTILSELDFNIESVLADLDSQLDLSADLEELGKFSNT